MSLSTRLSIGCDPEFFLMDAKGKHVSAIDLIPGSKDAPHMLADGAGLQTDNVALEFASKPVTSEKELLEHLGNTFKEVDEMLPLGMGISDQPSAEFTDGELTHPQARLFGCSPDYDAYTMETNVPPDPKTISFRSCGGHIHVGSEHLQSEDAKTLFVKLMDCFHGLVSTVLDASHEAIERRKLYGKAGCHRPTEYGIEYRVLSNYWLKHPQLVKLQVSLLEDAMKAFEDDVAEDIVDDLREDVVDVINNGDSPMAMELIGTHIAPHMSTKTKDLMDKCFNHTASSLNSIRLNWGIA